MSDIKIYTKVEYTGISTDCIVCDEPVELSEKEILRLEYGRYIPYKICSKCKEAILRVRSWGENDNLAISMTTGD